MKALCDHMLGTLATWLRILGVDTSYPSNTTSDEEILHQAETEGRVLLTRDKVLAARAKKTRVSAFLIHGTDLETHLRQVIDAFSLDLSRVLTRCTLCNSPLVSATPEDAHEHIPPRVFERQKEFWFCPSCRKYYWKGTHYEAMEKRLKTLEK